jgi:Uma2 family endonuclease
MPTLEKSYYSTQEYLELEVASEERHEYIDGQIIPMTGGLPNHNQIALNLSGALNFALRRKPYRVFVIDQRLWIPQKTLYTYPDVMVVSGELEFAEGRRDTITNPLLIAEVLSKSTRNYDRDKKFSAYRKISSFREYILIDQYAIHIEQFYKSKENQWIFCDYNSPEAILSLSALDFEISLLDIYDKVDFNIDETND